MPSEGGTAEQVTQNGGYEAFESADGRFLYYVKEWPTRGIWKLPVGGGEETQVLTEGIENRWDLLKDGICFLSPQREGQRAIKFLRFVKFLRLATGQIELVTEFPEGTRIGPGLTASPDGRWVLYSVNERAESDIQISRVPERSELKTILLPSGEYLGRTCCVFVELMELPPPLRERE